MHTANGRVFFILKKKRGDIVIIENQKIDIVITKHNIGTYRKRGYENLNVGDILSIGVNDLSLGSRTKVDVKCDYCENIISVAYKDYVAYKFDKYSCKHCRQKKTSEYNLKQRQESLYQRALEFCIKMGYKLLTKKEDILNSETRAVYECPKHGIHETKIYTLIDGHECWDCSYEKRCSNLRKSADDVYNDFKQHGGILLNKNDYISWNCKNLLVVCQNCGDVFITSYCAFMLRGGQLCSKCASNISRGEYAIKKYLEDIDIKFYMQFRFYNCRTTVPLPFDFYLPDRRICIEYDGEGHYKPIRRGDISDAQAQEVLDSIKYRDEIKDTYCNKNDIKLLRIPYWEFYNINDILNKELFT